MPKKPLKYDSGTWRLKSISTRFGLVEYFDWYLNGSLMICLEKALGLSISAVIARPLLSRAFTKVKANLTVSVVEEVFLPKVL